MAKLIFGMNVSLDGYVDHDHPDFMPDEALFRFFIEMTKGIAGSIYGRKLYELMQYWDGDEPGWSPAEREFAEAWRGQPKWVVSRTLETVGPNATLVRDGLETAIRDLKARLAKVILMILIVTLFEEALNMKISSPLDLLYLGGAIALIGAALFLTHKAEAHGKESEHPGD